jgi:hypothetical protein
VKAQTLADLSVPAEALRRLTAEHGGLPAAILQVSPFYPRRLDISLHPELSDEPSKDFETWRQALDMPAESVKEVAWGGSEWLTASGVFDEVEVCLTAFLPNYPQEES